MYGFADGKLTRERLLAIPLQPLSGARKTRLLGEKEGDQGVPYPAGIAVVPLPRSAPERLLVTDNLSDDALLIDVASGAILTRFDLSENDAVPSTYPLAVAVSRDGMRGYVALWNASEIVELDLARGVVRSKAADASSGRCDRAGNAPVRARTDSRWANSLCGP